MRSIALVALLAAGVSAPAFAQDSGAFSGLRVEGLAGYDVLKSGERDDGITTGNNEGDEDVNGAVFGVGVGYDYNIGNLVLGVEGEFTESTGKQDADESLDGFNRRIKTGRDLYAGVRIGAPVTPTTLVYAKGGYTNLAVENFYEGAKDSYAFDTNADGWRLGAGVEQMFGPKAYGKVEYRYSNYNNLENNNVDLSRDIDLDRHQIVAGVGIRF
jgi:outer membrane immunogenic protein